MHAELLRITAVLEGCLNQVLNFAFQIMHGFAQNENNAYSHGSTRKKPTLTKPKALISLSVVPESSFELRK